MREFAICTSSIVHLVCPARPPPPPPPPKKKKKTLHDHCLQFLLGQLPIHYPGEIVNKGHIKRILSWVGGTGCIMGDAQMANRELNSLIPRDFP